MYLYMIVGLEQQCMACQAAQKQKQAKTKAWRY